MQQDKHLPIPWVTTSCGVVEPPEVVVEAGWLFNEADASGEELVVGLPCFTLIQNVAAHHGSRGEQTEAGRSG